MFRRWRSFMEYDEVVPNPENMMMVYFNTPGGTNISKEMLQRVPDVDEIVYLDNKKYKVQNIATMLSNEPHMHVGSFKVRASATICFVKEW